MCSLGMKGKVIVVAIVTVDFDGTLYQGNSFKTMLQIAQKEFTVKQWGVVSLGLSNAVIAGLFKGKNAFRTQFFTAFAKSFKGKTKDEMDIFFQKLVDIGKKDVHHQLLNKIREHQQSGDQVILLSGALQPFLKAFLKEVELDVPIISTQLKFDEHDVCTGEISQIINGEEKVAQVRNWINRQEQQSNADMGDSIWAYADSERDLPLFQFANYPIVVNPNPEMKDIAKKNEWPIFAP
ncbi:MAG TPA: HAD family hydrolase [Bacillota bacterium]|nr:HAD family hydrolase [Bacillota bacterium]